jgi:hypothetical protein
MLLQFVDLAARVELLLYSDSPTELHSLTNKDAYDLVEIYPSSGKPTSLVQNFSKDSWN